MIARITESNIVSLSIAHNDITWVGLDPLLTLIPQTKISALYLWGNAFGLETWKVSCFYLTFSFEVAFNDVLFIR